MQKRQNQAKISTENRFFFLLFSCFFLNCSGGNSFKNREKNPGKSMF